VVNRASFHGRRADLSRLLDALRGAAA
jgi:hypothetical protein